MARVPEQEIERLKREVSLERLAEVRGVKLRSTGKDLMGLCPFHEDREPSLVITPDKNLWHCLGACQTGGTVIDWVMRAEGVSFRHAVELLRGGAAATQAARPGRPPPKIGTVKKMEPLASRDVDEAELLGRVAEVYHAVLKESPEALEYLRARGLEHPEVVERFRLGYANRTLGYRLPDKNRKEGAELRGKLTGLGIYRDSGHEHLAGSLVIPLFDDHDRVVNLYGRKVQDHLREGTPLHLYLPGPHRGVFNREGILASGGEVILCESLLDALTFWCAGFRNVTTAYGVEGFSAEILNALTAAEVRTVRIAFDRDDAGDSGAKKVGEKLNARGIETYRVLFPRGMDANEYALKVGPAAKSLELALRKAEWMGVGADALPRPIAVTTTTTASTLSEPTEEEASSSLPEIDGRLGEAREGAEPPSSLAASSASSSEATSPAPAPGTPRPDVEKHGGDLLFRFGDRKWRVRGLSKNASLGELRVNVLVAREGARTGGFFVDTVELYASRQRAVFVKQAADELEVDERVLRRELGQILLELEAARDAEVDKALEPKTPAWTMTEAEREEALALLRDPRLFERILEDLERSGIVGEETNKLVGYLAATSRKLEEPLAVVIQSSSAAGNRA